MATEEDVRRIAASLPETTSGLNEEGQLTVGFRGKGLAWSWRERVDPKQPKVPNREVLAVRVPGVEAKEELLASDPSVYFTEPHYNGYPAVLVRLAAIGADELAELLTDAWRLPGPEAPAEGARSVTALFDDLDASVAEAVAALRTVQDQDWTRLAGTLSWSCWETVEHVADDLFAYAAQVGVTTPETSTYVPFVFTRARPDAPALTVRADPERGNAGLVQVLDACGGFLSGVTRTASPEARGWHPYGVSDPAGFAAMGSVEVLLHLHDLATTLGFAWTPPAARVVRLLERLFPDLPCDGDPWAAMLRATGRDPRTPVDDWRWDGTVR